MTPRRNTLTRCASPFNRKLETFLKAAGIENDGAHRAMSDAMATAKLCVASMAKIK